MHFIVLVASFVPISALISFNTRMIEIVSRKVMRNSMHLVSAVDKTFSVWSFYFHMIVQFEHFITCPAQYCMKSGSSDAALSNPPENSASRNYTKALL